VSEPSRLLGTGDHQERGGDCMGDNIEQERDHVARLVLALTLAQVRKQLDVGICGGEQ